MILGEVKINPKVKSRTALLATAGCAERRVTKIKLGVVYSGSDAHL